MIRGRSDIKEKLPLHDASCLAIVIVILMRWPWRSRYREVHGVFERLLEDPERFGAAIRLTLLPEISSREDWQPYIGIVLGTTNASELSQLKRAGLLEDDRYPSFGLTSRYEFCRETIASEFANEASEIAESLIVALAREIHDANPSEYPYAFSLAVLAEFGRSLQISRAHHALCHAARSLLRIEQNPKAVDAIPLARYEPGLLPLLAMGLANIAILTSEVERPKVLSELRELAAAHPNVAKVRRHLLIVLYSTINNASVHERQALLVELREIAAAHADDSFARESLAKGLANAIVSSADEPTLLEELRSLAVNHPNEPILREALASGLLSVFHNSTIDRQLLVLEELRQLATAHPEEAELRGALATVLVDAIGDTSTEAEESRLRELRHLTFAHPAEPVLRWNLAIALFNSHSRASSPERTQLLEELRELVASNADDEILLAYLAKCLCNSVLSAATQTQLADELRNLFALHPDNWAVRVSLVKALLALSREESVESPMALFEELWRVALPHAHDPILRSLLAEGLGRALVTDVEERQSMWLKRLRHLAETRPEDVSIRIELARGLQNSILRAAPEGRGDWLKELLQLAVEHPRESAVVVFAARALLIPYFSSGGEPTARTVLLKLMADHVDSPEFPELLKVVETMAEKFPEQTHMQELLSELRHLASSSR